jgi:hypothetical protein
MPQNIEGEQKLKVWPFKKIPKEVINGTNPEKEEAYYRGLADGSIAITGEALEKLLNLKKVAK